MDLWIRNQDRDMLIRVDYVYLNVREYGCTINDRINVLGIYETAERALEVLDEIQKLLTPQIFALTNNIKENKKDAELTNCYALVGSKNGIDIKELSTVVYEMPKS